MVRVAPFFLTHSVYRCDLNPIQGQGQGHGAFELPTVSETVHAGGDDRSPLAGLSGKTCLGIGMHCPSASAF